MVRGVTPSPPPSYDSSFGAPSPTPTSTILDKFPDVKTFLYDMWMSMGYSKSSGGLSPLFSQQLEVFDPGSPSASSFMVDQLLQQLKAGGSTFQNDLTNAISQLSASKDSTARRYGTDLQGLYNDIFVTPGLVSGKTLSAISEEYTTSGDPSNPAYSDINEDIAGGSGPIFDLVTNLNGDYNSRDIGYITVTTLSSTDQALIAKAHAALTLMGSLSTGTWSTFASIVNALMNSLDGEGTHGSGIDVPFLRMFYNLFSDKTFNPAGTGTPELESIWDFAENSKTLPTNFVSQLASDSPYGPTWNQLLGVGSTASDYAGLLGELS